MEKKISVIISTVMVMLAVPVSMLSAQTEGASFSIPFSFVLADKQMPSGQYHVESLYWNAVGIQRSGGNVAVIVQCQPTRVPKDGLPKLIFHRYGDRYFLSEARLPRMDSGRKFYVTKAEVELARGMREPDNVEVAAK